MLIDWFTVGAQTLNFLILVWLMKRYLYKPVLDAIDAREKRIASELADAAQKQAQADSERDTFKQKNADFDQQREALARKASAEVDAERKRLLTDARTAADAVQAKRHEALESELQTLQEDIARRSQEEVFAIARKVLTDLAGTTLEDRITEVFAQRLGSMDAHAKSELSKALQASPGTVRVRSAFELTPAQQAALGQAMDAAMGAKLPIRFETTPDVIGGIELSANGWKIAWNISDFLASLQQKAS
ncbi:MAG: F0F1 ATP synthase subunit B [Burkholderiales bacterium]|jgi:F-type H+-transporting ATPase subunit b|nr:F0F1 ATP synthase subunit B [Burkholderiales bacterium]